MATSFSGGRSRSTLSLAAANRVHHFCDLQSRARTHAVLVIGLYELLGNPTTKLTFGKCSGWFFYFIFYFFDMTTRE
jgi:hypothetical protein